MNSECPVKSSDFNWIQKSTSFGPLACRTYASKSVVSPAVAGCFCLDIAFKGVLACPGATWSDQPPKPIDYYGSDKPIKPLSQPALVRRDVDIQLFSLLMNASLSITVP